MLTATEFLHGLFYKRHPRVRDHPLTASPTIVLSAMLFYMLMVLFGPRLMRRKNTPPLKHIMMVYNFGQVLLSGYMVREFWLSRPRTISWLMCSPIDVTTDERSQRLVDACMLFHFSKIIDFLDTLFLILKKEHQRMSYLHVYHHGTMVFGFWFATAFVPGGSTWFGGWLNSLVHCVMYSYYLLAALGPRVRPYLWWKRYLTQLQLAQFATIVSLGVVVQIIPARCGYPAWVLTMAIVYLIVLSIFFLNFYVNAYIHRPAAGAVAGTKPTSNGVVKNADVNANATSTPVGPGNVLKTMGRMLLSYGVGCYVKEE